MDQDVGAWSFNAPKGFFELEMAASAKSSATVKPCPLVGAMTSAEAGR
jgi:hypothetical protein